jgi:LEA14-like dessication related protein
MNGITKILLLAGAGAAVWYLPTLLALYNMQCSIISVLPTNMTGSKIDALATMKLTNNSSTRVDLTSIVADIMLNGVKIAQLNQTENLPILGNSTQNFNVAFSIDAEIVGTNIIAQLMAQNLQNFILEVKGQLIANSKKVPFDSIWTLKDFKS